MKRFFSYLPLFIPLAMVGVFVACSAKPPLVAVSSSYTPYGGTTGTTASTTGNWADPYKSANRQAYVPHQGGGARRSPASLYKEVSVKKDYLPHSSRGRTRKSMNPTYITIHSTQNWSAGADSDRHALALKRGALGRISWHYTTDDRQAVQHLPTNEQGNHADYDGPGNKYSIGIEMCEHPGSNRAATIDRTAKLAAWLMYQHNIPINRVVPHYRWPRWGQKPPNKNCPHFLMDNGRPGRKWAAFQREVENYYRQIASSSAQYANR